MVMKKSQFSSVVRTHISPRQLRGVETQKIMIPDAVDGDEIGSSLSLSSESDIAVIGAAGGDGRTLNTGAVYTYQKKEGVFFSSGKLYASDGDKNDSFGSSSSISGDGSTIAIGTYRDSDRKKAAGSVYIFGRYGDTWTEQTKLVSPTALSDAYFGKSVSLSEDGTVLLVGSDGEGGRGAAYIFTKTNGLWERVIRLSPGTLPKNAQFGCSVALSSDGTIAVVGACRDNGSVSGTGAIYLFVRQGQSYVLYEKIAAENGKKDDYFGLSLSISSDGKSIVTGAYGDDSLGSMSGSAYVFSYSDSSWQLQNKLTASDGTAGAKFGSSVTLSRNGNVLSVGSIGYSSQGANSGAVYVFRKEGDSWLEHGKYVSQDCSKDDRFGSAVAMDRRGTTLLVSSPSSGSKGFKTGSTYLFT